MINNKASSFRPMFKVWLSLSKSNHKFYSIVVLYQDIQVYWILCQNIQLYWMHKFYQKVTVISSDLCNAVKKILGKISCHRHFNAANYIKPVFYFMI